jgi:predicted acylesterase/phospholipase RssA
MNKAHFRLAGSGLNLTLYAGGLEACEDEGITPASGAGSSGGGMILAAWLSGMKAKEIQALLLKFMPPIPKLFDKAIPVLPGLTALVMFYGLYRMARLQKALTAEMKKRGVVHFKDFKVPFACFTTNMTNGSVAEWSTSKTPDAEVAPRVVDGGRLPVAMTPALIDGEHHRDGGIMYNYPIDFVFPEQDDQPTIGMLFKATATPQKKEIKSVIDDLSRCVDLMLAAVSKEHMEDAQWAQTIVLGPSGSSLDFFKTKEQAEKDFKAGYDSVISYLKKSKLTAPELTAKP